MSRWCGFLLLLISIAPVRAQAVFEYWPGADYDPKIPTVHAVLGYNAGEQISSDQQILKYLNALAASSGRIKIFEYSRSWEGRKLVYAAIGSETNIRRLSEIQADMKRLADPQHTSAAEAHRLIASLPAIVWLSYGVHGNEISSPEAALVVAYHLLAARHDQMVDGVLAHVLILIDPVQNPDGRDRFVDSFRQATGLEPDPSPLSAEHNEPWPTGRVNHYLFDLNRDWLALTQPETRSQVAAVRTWFPLVYVDLHEMTGDSSYFFSPEADPYNPNLTAEQHEALKLFGRNNARWFDHYKFDYFTREVYDAFYPGYGGSWPSYYGALAMTYEQASVGGLVLQRSDNSVLRFRDTVRQHFVASLSTLQTAAENREKLLNDFYRYRATAVEEGAKEPVREYILPRSRDTSATDKLAGILVEHGIQVNRAMQPFQEDGRDYPAGTYVVPMAQPAKRLIRTLLDSQTALDSKFVAAEETRRRSRQRSEIYDVTAWSLPLMFNVEAVTCSRVSSGKFEPATKARILAGELFGRNAAVAYLVPWGSEAAGRFLAAALRQGLHVFSSDRPLTQNGRTFPAGSLIVKLKDNPGDISERLARLARETGAEIYGADTGWVDAGVNFGSRYVLPVRKPAIAIAWDSPTAPSAAGATRFVLERQYGYPVTPVRVEQLDSAALGQFQVLILPPGGDYAAALGEDGVDRVKDWVHAGGTLIALGSAVQFVTSSDIGLLDIDEEEAVETGKDTNSQEKTGRVRGTEISNEEQYEAATHASLELPGDSPGAIVRARVQPDYWLTAGVGTMVNALVSGRAIYSPIKVDKGVNAVYFDASGQLLVSGYLWNENRKQLAYKPLVVAEPSERGLVIAFTEDPNFRAMLDGMNVLFLNAVFRGPSHTPSAASE
ncbi:MAG TPA: M14 family metallopeptidase [Bryobacteraceae bacterium]|nr:M14 family metallopeptidase [Bryobacteraceae bacterium]